MQLVEAFKLAFEIHGNQRDKTGAPYLFHVMRVAMAMKTDEERVVALLHDAVSSALTLESQVDLVRKIRLHFGDATVKTVLRLTRNENEAYMDYIRRLSTDKLAVKVKLADLADNMLDERLDLIPDVEAERLRAMYGPAYLFLGGDMKIEAYGHEHTMAEREQAIEDSMALPRRTFPEQCCAECHGPLDGAFMKRTPEGGAVVCSKCFTPVSNIIEMPLTPEQ
ncbi:hypothetical protein GCM10011507_03860 [Edaphobacter acidisoli]|uniref:HD domain-containing protein n=1 Tax=Edaphobacter acidisoli TaxID=2040573 RepID=A0A916VZL0_9BACT|nr:HD domain-containing protein [Edaphobacter acidisoli]GGA55802.1 hypothetical protein GCM10011507_03860 [Edaphobacter acidisoli]